MLSIIIPLYREPFLNQTINSLLESAEGDIEVIPVFDGTVDPEIETKDLRVKPVYLKAHLGMRGAINVGIKKSTGDFIMKCDAHCIFGKGFDKIMVENCAENWLMIPRRYSIDEKNWVRDDKRIIRDYHYIYFPKKADYGITMAPLGWYRRTLERRDAKYDIDDTMTFQGSCWLANRKYFMEHIGLLDGRKETYTPFGGEQLEIGLKYWLGGGEVKIIKKTWYGHLAKRKHHYMKGLFTRKYKKNIDTTSSRNWMTKHWMNNEEPNMKYPMSWLIEKFSPVPSWSDNWEQEWEDLKYGNATL